MTKKTLLDLIEISLSSRRRYIAKAVDNLADIKIKQGVQAQPQYQNLQHNDKNLERNVSNRQKGIIRASNNNPTVINRVDSMSKNAFDYGKSDGDEHINLKLSKDTTKLKGYGRFRNIFQEEKTLLDLIEIIEPRGEGEKRFFRLHSRNVKRHKDPAGNGDDVFSATNIKPVADNHMLPHADDRGKVDEASRDKLIDYMNAAGKDWRNQTGRKKFNRSQGIRDAFRKLNVDDPEYVDDPPKVAATYKNRVQGK